MSDVVLYEVRDRIATVTLNRPDARNALSRAVISGLRRAVADAQSSDEVDVIILTGTDPAFCSGDDVKQIMVAAGSETAARLASTPRLTPAAAALLGTDVPVIAAVNGAAVGWGMELAFLRMLRMGVDTHIITAHATLPMLLRGDRGLLVEMTDGTAEVNASYREQVGFFYDLVKANVSRIVLSLTHELRDRPVTALGLTPGWLRSEAMLDHFGVTEATWRDAVDKTPRFAISESPTYVARGLAALAQDPDVARVAGQVLTPRQLADRYGLTDTDGSRPDAWGHIATYGLDEQSGEDIERFR